MAENSEKYCLQHNIFYTGSNCPVCISELKVHPSFYMKVLKDVFEEKKMIFQEELEKHKYDYYYKQKMFNWLDWIDKIFKITEEDGILTFSLSLEKLFENQIIEKKKILELINNITSEFARLDMILDMHFSKYYLDDLIKSLNDLWQNSLIIEVLDNLDLKTKCPMIKDVSLKCWLEQKVIPEEKAIVLKLEHPMLWKEDVQTLSKKGFKILLSEEKIKQLEQLIEIEKEKYYKVQIKPHEYGIQIILYKHIDKEYKDRLEKGCTIKYWINKEQGLYEELKFIQRAPNLDYEDNIVYLAKYFTFPVILNYFKKEGFKVEVDESLFKQYPKLPCEIHKNFELYEVQKPAVKNWYENNQVGTVVLPTGGGKTIVGLEVLSQIKEWTLIVVPTIELKNQWIEFLTGYSAIEPNQKLNIPNLGIPREYVGEFYAGKKEVKPITIALFQSAHKHVLPEGEEEDTEEYNEEELAEMAKFGEEIGKLSENFGLLIADEGHHLAAPLWKNIAIHLKSLKRISLTATPERYDGNEPLLFFTLGDPIYKVTYEDLAKQKIVCPIVFQRVFVPLTETEKEILRILAELKGKKYWGFAEINEKVKQLKELYLSLPYVQLKKKKFEEKVEKAKLKGKDLVETFMIKRMQVRLIHCFAQEKFNKLLEIVKKHINDKILIFNEYVIGAKMIHDFLEENGIHSEILTGSTKRKERELIFDEFRKAHSGIIVTTTVLDEGINVPDCNVIIIFNGRRRRRQMIQRIGRGCRYRKLKIEYVYELVVEPFKKQKVEDVVKVGDTVYIIGGVKGNIGEKCIVEKITDSLIYVRSEKTGELYDKYPQNISKTPHGMPISLYYKSSYYKYPWDEIYENYLNYEYRISEERSPLEVIGNHEYLIKEVEKELQTAEKCSVDGCSNVRVEEKWCKEHLIAYDKMCKIVKTFGIKDLKELYEMVKGDKYMLDLYNEAVKKLGGEVNVKK